MSNVPSSSMAALRIRMIATALLVSVTIGGVVTACGGGTVALLTASAAALSSSLICYVYLRRVIAALRTDQFQIVTALLPQNGTAEIQAEPDSLRALEYGCSGIMCALESRQDEQQQLERQILSAQEKLTLIMHGRSAGDEKERQQVQDAVAVMERLDCAFSQVIAEIGNLSGRTEERASISTQMTATTEAIAENINRYSSFVIGTSSSIEEMACAIRETADNIRALSASTEQSVSSINTISASQTTVRDNSERSATASENVRTQAQQGLRSMSATMRAIQEIAKSNEESFESINRLSRHSTRVGEFLSVIQEVAEQTNLLSLNASIIAAQAGTRGRAFAVVAEEVRSLARRTSASTREIEELVCNIQKETASVLRSVTQGKDKVEEGVKISRLANEALVMIDLGAEDAFRMVSNIAVETNEQAANIQRISEEAGKNLERVRQVTLATEQQQQGASLIVNNLEQMRDLAQRIKLSAQEQAKGNRLYLKSVMEDNDRTRELNKESDYQIRLAGQAVEAVRGVESQIGVNLAESQNIVSALAELTELLGLYRGGTFLELHEEVVSNV